MFDPLKDVLPVARAPSKLALLKFACPNLKVHTYIATSEWPLILYIGIVRVKLNKGYNKFKPQKANTRWNVQNLWPGLSHKQ